MSCHKVMYEPRCTTPNILLARMDAVGRHCSLCIVLMHALLHFSNIADYRCILFSSAPCIFSKYHELRFLALV